jgi:hypothetical protein
MATAFERAIKPQLHTEQMAQCAYQRRNAAYAELERLDRRRHMYEIPAEASTIAPPAPGEASAAPNGIPHARAGG